MIFSILAPDGFHLEKNRYQSLAKSARLVLRVTKSKLLFLSFECNDTLNFQIGSFKLEFLSQIWLLLDALECGAFR